MKHENGTCNPLLSACVLQNESGPLGQDNHCLTTVLVIDVVAQVLSLSSVGSKHSQGEV